MDTLTAVVIDADPGTRHLTSHALHSSGFTVHTARTGPEGVLAVHRHRPDLVTTTMTRPGLTGPDPIGPDLIGQIRTFSNTPLMIISDSDALEDLEAGFSAGADQYLVTPVTPALLQAHAQALLRRPA
jgi:two-component system OmpR family response regulator